MAKQKKIELTQEELQSIQLGDLVDEYVKSGKLCRDQGYYHFAHLTSAIESEAKRRGIKLSEETAQLIGIIALEAAKKAAE